MKKVIELYLCPCQTADKPYQDAFDHELEMLKARVRSCAQIRMESAMKELEEEEKQKRLGPGGLDPLEVYESLPKVKPFTHHCNHCKITQSISVSMEHLLVFTE